MFRSQPRIANRFPRYRELILQKCNGDATIAELCQDYDSVVGAIDAIESKPGSTVSPDDATHDLLKLANALEKELLYRLGLVRCLTRDRSRS